MPAQISKALLVSLLLSGVPSSGSHLHATKSGFDLVDKAGNIRKPPNYRDLYQSFGAYTVLDGKGG